MNLEEFRKSLESDATDENRKLRKELESLKRSTQKEKRMLSLKVKALSDDCRALSNRCYAMYKGAMCCFCEFQEFKCQHAGLKTEESSLQKI